MKPKVKQFCLKNVSIWQRGKKVVQLARVSQAEAKGKASTAGQFLLFCRKNSHFNAIWIKFRTYLEPFERDVLPYGLKAN